MADDYMFTNGGAPNRSSVGSGVVAGMVGAAVQGVNKYVNNKNNSSNYNGGGGGGGGYGGPSYADAIAEMRAMLEEQARIKREATIRAIQAQVDQAVNNYQGQLGELPNTYQPLKNQSEVERYKAMRALRETQANRGALDSGIGRQENLDLSTNYANRLNNINLQEQSEADAIRRAIADVQSQGELQKANAESESALLSLQNNFDLMKEQLSARQSSARSTARSLASGNRNTEIGSKTESAASSGSSTAGLSAAGASLYNNLQQVGGDDASIAKYIQSAVKQGTITAADAKILAERYGFNVQVS